MFNDIKNGWKQILKCEKNYDVPPVLLFFIMV